MLKPQFLNYVDNSFNLWLENHLLTKGSGIFGQSSYFYPLGQKQGYFVYGAPYQPIIANENISGNITPTGIYVNGTFYNQGQGNFVCYDYKRGWALFNANVGNHTKVSGTYSVAEVQILPLQIPEEKLLFETKFDKRKPNTSPLSGLAQDSYSYPAIYVKGALEGHNAPYELGGKDETEIDIGLFVIADSAYQLSAIKSILMDANKEIIPLLTTSPYNMFGGQANTGVNYHYYHYTSGALANNSGLYVKDVAVSSFNRFYNADFSKLNPDVYFGLAEFTICRPRLTRRGGL